MAGSTRQIDRGRLLVLAIASLISLLYVVRIRMYDIWWHLATARWIIEHREIPTTDPFSFTARGEPWIFINWLAELVLYAIYNAFGVVGLVVMKPLAAFAMLLLLAAASKELGVKRPSASAVCVGVVGFLVQPRFTIERPMIIGAVLLAASVYLASRWWARRDRSLFLFVPLVLLWIPMHGTSILAFGPLAAVSVSIVLAGGPRRHIVEALLVSIVTAIVFLSSASGRGAISLASGGLAGAAKATAMTQEWKPMSLAERFVWVPYALLGCGLLASLIRHSSRMVPLILAAFGLVISTGFVRNVYEMTLLAAPAWCLGLDDVLAALEARGLRLIRGALPSIALCGLPLIHLGVMPSRFLWSHNFLNLHFGTGIELHRYPHDTLQMLKQLPPGNTIHDQELGGYLLWNGIPNGVFIDGRTVSLYTDAILERTLIPAQRSPEDLEVVADRYDAVYAIVQWEGPIAANMMRSDGWVPIQHGESTTLFVRRKFLSRVTALGFEPVDPIRFVAAERDPEWMKAWYATLLASDDGRERLERAIERNRALSPASDLVDAVVRFRRDLDATDEARPTHRDEDER